ncbi:MAG: methylated-DNA--[Clostridia bacterium]|nr:methylated-DNA--[protein]-cysteine S-methyltransferase [Clostridia bacterium]
MRRYSFSSPLGPLTLCEESGRLSALLFEETPPSRLSQTPLLLEGKRQLTEYFGKDRTSFDLPLLIGETPFSRALFSALLTVPFGETVTYGELAALSGFPRAARAVGNCLHTNPLPILVPCHRVVGATGLGNFAWGMEKKLFLMRLEGMDV